MCGLVKNRNSTHSELIRILIVHLGVFPSRTEAIWLILGWLVSNMGFSAVIQHLDLCICTKAHSDPTL